MTSKVKKELTCLTQFRILTQARSALAPTLRKSQLSECLATMLNMRYCNHGSYFKHKKMIPSGTYAGRELLSIVEGMVELNQFVVDDQVI